MIIDSVEFFYAAMPEITLEADGSQDALLVRVTADGHVGWGECEASPLTSIAAFVTPRSHGVCQPVADSVLGERLDSPADIARLSRLVERNSMDLLQPRTRGRGSRSRCGMCSVRRRKSRCGGSSATARASRSFRTRRCSWATPRS